MKFSASHRLKNVYFKYDKMHSQKQTSMLNAVKETHCSLKSCFSSVKTKR